MNNFKAIAKFGEKFESFPFQTKHIPDKIWIFGEPKTEERKELLTFIKWMREKDIFHCGGGKREEKTKEDLFLLNLKRMAESNYANTQSSVSSSQVVYLAMIGTALAFEKACLGEVWVGQGKWEKYDN